MSIPTSGTWRNSYFTPALGRLREDLVRLHVAVVAEESSYDSTNYDVIVAAFDSIDSLLADIQSANDSGINP